MKLTQNATVAECWTCGERVIAGICGATLKPIVLDLTVLDVPAFIALRARRGKVYAVDYGGIIVGPLTANTEYPMNAWRPVHPHPWTPPEESKPSWHEPSCWSHSAPPGGFQACSCPPPPSEPPQSRTAPLRAFDEACRLLVQELGAVMLQKESNGRTVFRGP